MERAVKSWCQARSSAFLDEQSRHLVAAEEAFLTTSFPEAWEGDRAEVDEFIYGVY